MANYTSIFKIEGKPILPPLMTLEKRFEMQMYREKAIQLERNFTDEREKKKVQFCETATEVTPPEEFNLDYVISDSASARSTDFDENIKNPSEISSSLPSSPASTIVREKEMIDFGTNTQSCGNENDTMSRMMKLSKSETICFDVNVQTLVGTLTKEQMEKFRLINENKVTEKLTKEEKARIRLINANKESNGEIQKLLHSLIPSICIDPPTPISGLKNICDTLSGSESVDSFTHSGFQSSSQATENPVLDISDDGSTGESIENTISSTQRRSTGSAARMLHFEETQNEELANEEVEDSPELNINLRSPQRSATSPSLKSLSDTNGTCSLTTSPRADDMSRQSMVRSNSFTLEKPSKVLLDHMGQQKREVANEEKEESSNRSPTPSRRTTIITERSPQSPNAWRDTIESKAKRVQKKIDTKPSIVRSKSKAVFHNYATNAKQILTKTPPPLKIKRSPYDPKVKLTQNKQNNKGQMSSRNQRSNTVRKSSSSTTYTVQPTVRVPVPSINKIAGQTAPIESDNIMNDIDKRHREKLLILITQQQEEQRRLQHAFESQQRLLLEQLNNEKYNHLPMATDVSSPALQIEGVSGCHMSPALNFTNENAASPLNCSTVTNNSIISPGMRDVLGGFASNANCELPFNFPLKPNSLHLASSAVEVPSLNHTNNGKFCEKFASAMENKERFLHEKTANRNFEQLNAAASTINAYARGFLVRRLFQTEQIQRIVQTIRDTLIFVLNLHMETMENPKEGSTATNIKLKARLLQQLASASRTLHLIFFQTSIKERMEIISRDRKRIKAKLLSMSLKRSPRVA